MYATLDDVKSTLKTSNALTTADQSWIKRQLRQYSSRMARYAAAAGYDFEPRYATMRFTARTTNVNSDEMLFTIGKDLLEIDSITTDGTTLTLNTSVWAEPRDERPIRVLRIDPDFDATWWPCNTTCDPYNTIVITGFWGFRRYYDSEGWLSAETVQNAGGISAAATSITVIDIDGADYYGLTPRVSAGNLLRIDDELIEVLATDTTTNVATIIRGQRGSTAAVHAEGAVIKVWNIEPEVREVCAQQVAYAYARKGSFQTSEMGEFGVITYPADLIAQLRAVIQEMQYA